MAQRPKVLDRDLGWKAVIDMVKTIARDKPRVAVGIVGEQATMPHRGGGGTVADIAFKHENGVGTPRRAFIAPTIDANRDAYLKALSGQMGAALTRTARTKSRWSASQAPELKRLGLKVSGDMKRRILNGITPPLSKYTLARKGRGKTTPLVDSGHLVGSIAHQVKPKS